MSIDREYCSIVFQRILDSRDPFEQIVLISGKDKQRFVIDFPLHQ